MKKPTERRGRLRVSLTQLWVDPTILWAHRVHVIVSHSLFVIAYQFRMFFSSLPNLCGCFVSVLFYEFTCLAKQQAVQVAFGPAAGTPDRLLPGIFAVNCRFAPHLPFVQKRAHRFLSSRSASLLVTSSTMPPRLPPKGGLP